MIRYGLAFLLSFVFASCWTPLMRRAAEQLGIVDSPDGKLKKHGIAVPYFGGLAIYIGFLLTLGVFTDFGTETLGLLLSGTIALMVGLIDDFGVLSPAQKLLGQTLAALVLIKSGTYIKLTYLPVWVAIDRKSTRLNSSHITISYAVFCLKKKTSRIVSYFG